jgi:hypothetical protein
MAQGKSFSDPQEAETCVVITRGRNMERQVSRSKYKSFSKKY